jgi:hypothetical protein
VPTGTPDVVMAQTGMEKKKKKSHVSLGVEKLKIPDINNENVFIYYPYIPKVIALKASLGNDKKL